MVLVAQAVGSICEIVGAEGPPIAVEVVGFNNSTLLTVPLGDTAGIRHLLLAEGASLHFKVDLGRRHPRISVIGRCRIEIPDDLAPRMSAVWWDTIATLGWLAGLTDRTHLLSSVFNLSYRHPLASANSYD